MMTMLVNALWQVPMLFAAGLVVARLLRPFGPLAQYRVWLSVAALEVAIPCFSMVPCGWVPGRLAWFRAPVSADAGQVTVLSGPAKALGQLHLPQTVLAVAMGLYVGVTGLLVARLLWRCWQLWGLRRRCDAIELTPVLEELRQDYERRFGTQARLVAAPGIAGPMTIGLWDKLLILPEGMIEALATEEVEALLAHEFAHMRRNDFATNLALQIFTLPIAFHPALWLTRVRVVECREVVCDGIAAEASGRLAYTRSLLRLATRLRAKSSSAPPYAIRIFDAHPLERRLMNLTLIRGTLGRRYRLVLTTATLAVTTLTCGTALALRVSLNPELSQAASASPKAVQVSAGVMAGEALVKVNPVYPPKAKAAKIQGSVLLHAVIGTDGKIASLSVISGPPELTQSAVDAVRQWTYKPYLLNGEPTAVETTITVNYSFGG
jgi:TonB family protein